jgi:hypothetical protein
MQKSEQQYSFNILLLSNQLYGRHPIGKALPQCGGVFLFA